MGKPNIKTVFQNILLYLLLGGLWILITDRILLYLVKDPQTITLIQTYKGLAFVAATAAFLYFTGRRDISALEYYHETLQKERYLTERIMETSPVGIMVVNRDGKITFANYWAEQVLGLTRDEIMQLAYNAPVWHITDFDGNPFPEEKLPFNRVMKTRQSVYDVRHAIEWPDGNRVLLSLNAAPLLDENGLVEGMAATVEDVTKRIEAEKKLRESENRFRTAFEQAVIGKCLTATDGHYFKVNRALCEMLGYSEEELISRHFNDITHPDDRTSSLECAKGLLEGTRDVCHLEKRYIHKDGHTVWVVIGAFLYRDMKGNPVYFINDIQDITERKRVEEALRKSEEVYRTLAEAAQDAIYIISREDRVEYVNSFGARLFGLQPDKVIGRQRETMFPPDVSRRQKEEMKKVFEIGRPIYAEDNITFFKGNEKVDVWMHTSLVPLRDEAGEVVSVMGISRDITEHKRAEEGIYLLQIITKAVSESEDFNSAVAFAIKEICRETGWSYGEAWIPLPGEAYLKLIPAWYGGSKDIERFRKATESFKFYKDIGIPGRVWSSHRSVWVKDVSVDNNFPRSQIAAESGLRAGMGIPVLVGDEVVAVLGFFAFKAKEEDERLVALISSIAAQLGTLFRRRLADEALVKSESRLRAIIETEPECIKMVAADGTLLDMNPAGLAIIEADSLEQVKGASVYAFIDPEYREKYKQMNEDIFRGKSGTLEFKITGLKGTTRWFENHGAPFRNANNEIVAQLAITRDITERKRVEEELRLLQTLLQDIILSEDFSSAINVSIRKICEATGWVFGEAWVSASDGSHLDCSPEWYGSFEELKKFRKISEGFKFQPGIGLPGRVWLSKKPAWVKDVTLDSNFPRAPYAMEAGLKAAMGIPILAGDEVVAVLDFFVLEARDEDRRLVDLVSTVAAYLGILFQRKKVEGELRKLYYAVEQSPASVFITDADMNIEYVNPKFTAITGYTREEVIGKKPDILTSGTAVVSAAEWHGEFLARKKNGDPFWEYATISPILNREGVITNFIGVHEDITERRKVEDQLRHAQKMEAIGQLVGGIAHDFNNILTAIIGFAGVLRMQMKSHDPLLVHVEQIIESGERGANLTQSLLLFGRKQTIYPVPLNINDIIEKVERFLRRLIGENIELKVSTSDNPLTVLADGIQIEQVLINLATNARDAMPDGGTMIIETSLGKIDREFIKTHGYGDPRDYALISISDTGTGMDEKIKERVFEPFFTTKDVGKGTGLGLSIVYGIVKQHNGYINVYSEVGAGTTIRIYLPLVKSEEVSAEPSKPFPAVTGTETVLVAEDDEKVRRLSRTLLESFGYHVVEAADGEEAVLKYMENKDNIQILLLDMMMPKKNGKEVYEEIRKVSPAIKVLFMSGYTADVIQGKGIIEAGLDFAPKPIAPTEFLKKVREVLDK